MKNLDVSKWTLIMIMFLAVVFIVVSAVLFEDAWSWYPWKTPAVIRQHAVLPWQEDGVDLLSAVMAAWFGRLLIGTILIYLFPERIRLMSDSIGSQPRSILSQLAFGFLTTVGVIGVMLAAVFSAHTFPLAVLLGFAYITVSMLGVTSVYFWFGTFIMQLTNRSGASPLNALWVGTTILFALSRVPYFGLLVFGLIWIFASGLMISTRFGTGKPWTLAPLEVEEIGS